MDGKYQNDGQGCQPDAGALVDSVLAAISPWRCALCHGAASGMDLCVACLDDLPWLGAVCRHCGLPLDCAATDACAGCAALPGCPAIDRCIPALSYEFPVDHLITGIKYRRKLAYARVLGELLAIRLHEAASHTGYRLPEMIVPVPLHPWRLLRRSFNQSAEIARWVGAEMRLPCALWLVRRLRNTASQAGLSRAARLQNMRRAFALTAPVAGRRIALLDDVITTGATAVTLARLLKRGGAQEVQVWAAARTIG